jgi:hypothetical protein
MSIEYLKNNFCKFKPLFNLDLSINKNILSACFFRKTGVAYRDMSLYVNGLVNLNQGVKNNYSNFRIRLFIDNSIYKDKKIMNIIDNCDYVDPVLFLCENYVIENDYHVGLFGTLIRFFPMFDFPNNDAKLVVISDIDTMDVFDTIKKTEKIFTKYNNIKCVIMGNIGKKLIYREHKLIYKNKLLPYILSQRIVSIQKLPNKIIENYLEKVDTHKDTYYSSYYNAKLFPNENNSRYEKNTLTGNYIYGVDEYFLNDIVVHYLVDNNLPFAVFYTIEPLSVIYYGYKLMTFYRNNRYTDILVNILQKILKTEETDIEKLYKLFDLITYNGKNQKEINDIYIDIYKLYIDMYTNRDKYNKFIPKDLLFVYFKINGIKKMKKIIFYNTNISPIILKLDKFDNPKYIDNLIKDANIDINYEIEF